MAKELNLNYLEKELETSIQEYTNMSLNNEELTKIQALQILSKEFKLVSDEKARTFNEDIQLKRYELDKDKIYEAQKLERDKFNHEKDINEKNYELNIKKLDLDLLKVQNEQRRLDLDEKIYISNEANKKFEKVLSTSVEILKILIPIIGSICSTGIYVKFMKQCMSITMIDNGIVSKPTQEIIKQFDKYAKIKI